MSEPSGSTKGAQRRLRFGTFLMGAAVVLLVVIGVFAVYTYISNQQQTSIWPTQTALAMQDLAARETWEAMPTRTPLQLATDWEATQEILREAAPTETILAETQWAEPIVTARAQTETAAPLVTEKAATREAVAKVTGKAATATLGALATSFAIEQNYQAAQQFIADGYWDRARKALEAVLAGDPSYKDAKEQLAMVEEQLELTASVTGTPRPSNYHWSQRTTLAEPAKRVHYGMVFDSLRNVHVLYGGISASQVISDTWEFDGERWWQMDPGAAPAARSGMVMVYDGSRRAALLFGGLGAAEPLGDTWTYNGSWTQLAFESAPSPRANACGAYDQARKQVVVFGGSGLEGPVDETWVLDGDEWGLQEVEQSPAARTGCSMVYDPGGQQVILFGGRQGSALLNDTWTWDGEAWTAIETDLSPSPRTYHAMTYHARSGRVLLFGGGNGTCATYKDAWTFDGANWVQADFGDPGVRAALRLSYDPTKNITLFFGGQTVDAGVCRQDAETWELVLR